MVEISEIIGMLTGTLLITFLITRLSNYILKKAFKKDLVIG